MHSLTSIAKLIDQEALRQEQDIELIASENYASPAVLQAQGSILTNKYAEGYPGKRYYGGCQFVDQIEEIAIERAKMLFGASYANVQAHSGTQANLGIYSALLQAGDRILSMDLNHGGHLSHGSKVSSVGKLYEIRHYGVTANGEIDYDEVRKIALEFKPKLIVAGFSAFSGILDWAKFRSIADELTTADVKVYLLADIAHVAGPIAAGLYPSPLPYADVVSSTTHKTLRGPRGGLILAGAQSRNLFKKLNMAIFPGNQGGPLMHVIAAKAIAFGEALTEDFINYQKQILANSQTFSKELIKLGFSIVSGGSSNHMFLLDLSKHQLTGAKANSLLEQHNITANKNAIPNDPRPPQISSGLRIGTPAITTRGFKEKEIKMLANWIKIILDRPGEIQNDIKEQVINLCTRFPVYQNNPQHWPVQGVY